MNLRQEKQQEFFVQHIEIFKKLGVMDPFFVIKTAFFQKGKYGRHVQFFEWELKKGEDIFIEFYDNVNDNNGSIIDYIPFFEERLLFKYRVNPHYSEEYEQKENINQKTGEPYSTYTVPMSELVVVTSDGREVPYPTYEKNKEQYSKEEIAIPRLQNSLVFPDFEQELTIPVKETKEPTIEDILVGDDAPITDLTITDLAAILWKKPVSNKVWLNSLIQKQ